jgi:hypothetical protein
MLDPGYLYLVIPFGIVLGLTHFFSHRIYVIIEHQHLRVLSFSGGTLAAFLFLIILPEVLLISRSSIIYLMMLLGVVIFHLAEKELYRHAKGRDDLEEELGDLHIAGFFVEHFILGFVFVTTLGLVKAQGVLFMLPVFLYTLTSSLALHRIHEKSEGTTNKLILSAAPLTGVVAASFLTVSVLVKAAIIAFAFGMLVYMVIRDIIPRGRQGEPLMFVAGLSLVVVAWALIGI